MQKRSYADAGGIRTPIPYLFTSSRSQKQKSAIRHHVSHGYVYTNTWSKVADSITVSSNPNEPCHENLSLEIREEVRLKQVCSAATHLKFWL